VQIHSHNSEAKYRKTDVIYSSSQLWSHTPTLSQKALPPHSSPGPHSGLASHKYLYLKKYLEKKKYLAEKRADYIGLHLVLISWSKSLSAPGSLVRMLIKVPSVVPWPNLAILCTAWQKSNLSYQEHTRSCVNSSKHCLKWIDIALTNLSFPAGRLCEDTLATWHHA